MTASSAVEITAPDLVYDLDETAYHARPEFSAIPGFPGYEASPDGEIRSPRKVLKQFANNSGHLYVFLRRGGETHRRYVHRLILTTFVSPPPTDMEGCHNDGDPSNNAVENLRWDTRAANVRDAILQGRHNNARKTHCKHGHELTPENLYPGNRRQCIACARRRASSRKETS